MKYFTSLMTAAFLMAGLFSPIASAEDPAMLKLNLLHMEKVQTPYSPNPLADNIIKVHRYVVYDHHGRKKICKKRHCNRWVKRHDHHGRHYSVCTKWHYTRCHYPHH